jgi:hypothetical protein
MPEEDDFCERNGHYFLRVCRWWLRPKNSRWKCLFCGVTTRYYDGVDARALRPVHPLMGVAWRGVNAFPGKIH